MDSRYLERYAYQGPQIEDHPHPDTGMIIAIPAFNEPDSTSVLHSLKACVCPACHVEVIVVINHPENASEEIIRQSRGALEEITRWASVNDDETLTVHPLFAGSLPTKSAGVGLARKIGMDEAVWRFQSLGKTDGLIIGLDMDCRCAENYLKEIHNASLQNENFNGGVVFFEHPLEGIEINLKTWITLYELHLRYYVDALRMTGYPYAYHTIGSTMVTTSKIYEQQGGMNQRKAGEDFYFLQKIIPQGGFYRINTTTVFPEGRLSDRVPFGTGKALTDMSQSAVDGLSTYHWKSFEILKVFFDWVSVNAGQPEVLNSYKRDLPAPISAYLDGIKYTSNMQRILKHTTSKPSFLKSFFHWFNGLKILQFMHFCRDHFHPNIPITNAATWLCKHYLETDANPNDRVELLHRIRQWDRMHV